MARSYTAGVHISAPLIILLICSLLDRGRTQQQMSTPYQTFYQGLEVLTKAAVRNELKFLRCMQIILCYDYVH